MQDFSLILGLFLGVLGALSASFTGVVAERLNTGGSWLRGRSRCNTCDRTLGVPDLIPILSWIFSKGACRTCKAPIPLQYAALEALFALLFVLSYLRLGISISLLLLFLILIVLGALVLYDIRHTIVPESLSKILFVLAVLFALSTTTSASLLGMTFLVAGLIGLCFFLLYACSSGRAMGLGDAPIALSLALIAGKAAIPGLLFSFWIGAIFGIIVLVLRPKGHRMGIEVPFVPFLACGFLLAYFTGWNPLDITLL